MKKSFKVVLDLEMNANELTNKNLETQKILLDELTKNDEILNEYIKNEILLLLENVDLDTLKDFGLRMKKYNSILESASKDINEEDIEYIQDIIKTKIKDIKIVEEK